MYGSSEEQVRAADATAAGDRDRRPCIRRFSDLFALAEDVDCRSKRKSVKKKLKVDEGNSDSEASEVSGCVRRILGNMHDSVI